MPPSRALGQIWRSLQEVPAWRWLLVALVLMVLIYGSSVLVSQSMVVDGRRAFWLHDDMMISMRYARSLTQGYGLLWNPGGPRVEGYSNFGWVLVMAAIHLLPIPATMTSLAVLAINVVLAGAVLFLTTRLIHKLEPQATLEIPAVLLSLIVLYDVGRWTVIGLETVFLTALFLWLALRVLDEAAEQCPRASTFLLAGLLGLVRVDGVVWAGLLCLLALALQRTRRRVLAWSCLALVLPAIHVLFRLAYYGAPLPNTYYLKLTGWDRTTAGLQYAGRFLTHYGIAWAWSLLGAWYSHDRRTRALCLLGVPLLGYSIYVGGDDFSGARFFAPWLPILVTLALLTPRWLGWPRHTIRHALALAGTVLLLVVLNPYNFWRGPTYESWLLRAGLIVRDDTPLDTSLAHYWAGTLPYFAERPAIDLLGKSDAWLARQQAHPNATQPGHNKFDYQYSVAELRPDIIVGYPPGLVAQSDELKGLAEGNAAYVGQLFLNPVFQNEYAPSLALLGPVPLYIRADSPARTTMMQGACRSIQDPNLRALGLRDVCRWER